jgi:hypothetical protein
MASGWPYAGCLREANNGEHNVGREMDRNKSRKYLDVKTDE